MGHLGSSSRSVRVSRCPAHRSASHTSRQLQLVAKAFSVEPRSAESSEDENRREDPTGPPLASHSAGLRGPVNRISSEANADGAPERNGLRRARHWSRPHAWSEQSINSQSRPYAPLTRNLLVRGASHSACARSVCASARTGVRGGHRWPRGRLRRPAPVAWWARALSASLMWGMSCMGLLWRRRASSGGGGRGARSAR
jgi:hypothetical protein